MVEKLTYEQRNAVENRGGKLLVSAAAGSGKTKVLVDRLISYILDHNSPANIDDFLIITYTKAAAAELRGKIASKLSELIAVYPNNRHLQQQMQRIYLAKISTVHAFCADVLRQYAYRLDITSDFRVSDESESQQLRTKALDIVLERAYETADSNPEFRAFVDTQGLGRDDRLIPDIIQKVYNSAMCHLNPSQWLDWCVSAAQIDSVDVGKTACGSFLVEDLHSYLNFQIDSLNNCILAMKITNEMEKPVLLLQATVNQLADLAQCSTWDEIVEKKKIDYGRLVFSKNCSDMQLVEQVKAVRNSCKEGVEKKLRSFVDTSEQVLKDIMKVIPSLKGLIWLVKEFSNQYSSFKKSYGILDFNDLEHKMLDLLLGKQRTTKTAIAFEIGERFREVMVDEYQDSNEIQDTIFTTITSKNNNCFMVGDVKQSIYQFRLADPTIFLDKYHSYVSFEDATPGNGRKILLSQNFRSSNGVIQCVNDVFTQCMSHKVGGLEYGTDEMLREGITHTPLNDPEVSLYAIDVNHDTYSEEAAFVSNEIVSLLDGNHYVRNGDSLRPIVPEDIAILLRSPGSVGQHYISALQMRGIRCVTGDSSDLLQTEEISTIQSFLQVISNPLQDIPLVAVLSSPVFGFSSEDFAQLRSTNRSADIFTLISSSSNEKCIRFVNLLNGLRMDARLYTITQLLAEIYSRTDLLSIYSAMPDGAVRLNNLQAFYQITSDYEVTGPKDLNRFLEFLDANTERGLCVGGAQRENGAVTLMSIHKSKGLEFPVVFLCGLSRSFNQESIRSQVLCDKELGIGLSCVDQTLRVRYPTIYKRAISTKMLREHISEELRVLYVAMTRARDRLYMTYAEKNLASVLQDIAMRLDMCNPKLMSMDVSCPGEWILQSALKRTEAGALFELAGHPMCASVSSIPWRISVISEIDTLSFFTSNEYEREVLPECSLQTIWDNINFSYPWKSATQVPSKLTATQLKGRNLDIEVSEGAVNKKTVEFRKPGRSVVSGKKYGNALHLVLQYIRYDSCDCMKSIEDDINRMVKEELILQEEADLIDCKKLFNFFSSPLGKKLITSTNVLREFKFSILDDAAKYFSETQGEEILLQGVVDCAIIDEDGIVVLDFKTDFVTEDSIAGVAESYRSQIEVYAEALKRIFQIPVKSVILYFFSLNRFYEIF